MSMAKTILRRPQEAPTQSPARPLPPLGLVRTPISWTELLGER